MKRQGNSYIQINSWQELQDALSDSDTQTSATYVYGMAQQLDIAVRYSKTDGCLLLEQAKCTSPVFDADDDVVLDTLGRALDFFSRLQKTQQKSLEEEVKALRDEVLRLRETLQASAMASNDLSVMDSESWADFVKSLHDIAKAAGGSIETFGRSVVCYFRCARLKHRSIMSPALLKAPYHSGQNHRIRFALPQDTELMRRCLEYDAKLYQKLQAANSDNAVESAEAGVPAPES